MARLSFDLKSAKRSFRLLSALQTLTCGKKVLFSLTPRLLPYGKLGKRWWLWWWRLEKDFLALVIVSREGIWIQLCCSMKHTELQAVLLKMSKPRELWT